VDNGRAKLDNLDAMYVVKPRLAHFTWLLLLGPLVVFEAPVFHELLQQIALDRGASAAVVQGKVTEFGKGPNGELNLRYRFRTTSDGPWYSATDATGRRDLWIAVAASAWSEAATTGVVAVTYLRSDPWVNRPVARTGSAVADISAALAMLVGLDVFALYEMYMVRANFRRCQLAASQYRACRVRYWESRPAT
jgi:hypothetical protein